MDLPQLQSAPADALRSQDMLQAQLGIAVSSASSIECLFLDKLAPEIRNQIYSYLLVNPLLSTGRSASLSPACNAFDSQGLVTKVSNVRCHPSHILLLLLAFANCFNRNVMLTCSAVHVSQRLFWPVTFDAKGYVSIHCYFAFQTWKLTSVQSTEKFTAKPLKYCTVLTHSSLSAERGSVVSTPPTRSSRLSSGTIANPISSAVTGPFQQSISRNIRSSRRWRTGSFS